MKKYRRLMLCLVLCVCLTRLAGQDLSPDTVSINISSSLSSGVDDKINAIDNRLTKQSEKYLKSLSKQEEKIFKKLAKIRFYFSRC